MKHLFLLILLGLSLPMFAQSEKSHLAELQQKWTNAKTYTLALAESMPAEKYGFRPVEGEMSGGGRNVVR